MFWLILEACKVVMYSKSTGNITGTPQSITLNSGNSCGSWEFPTSILSLLVGIRAIDENSLLRQLKRCTFASWP